ncbi:MAG: outer membrane protein transport protein [Mariprofundaceae bacterium]|nr:outer membrane protein transport protein [Mariprofundaceae bacterium]
MRKLFKRSAVLLVACVSTITAAQAGGFQIGEMGIKATGLANAYTAVADDASAAWYNPAGLAFVEGTNVVAGGVAIIVPGTDFVSNAANSLGTGITATASDNTFFIPHAYFSYNDSDTGLTASLGINSPFGLETEWPTTSPFASKATLSRINMVNINGNVTFRISDRLAIAAGVSYGSVYKVDLNSTVQNLSGDGTGWGGNAALFYKGDTFNFGVSYRSSMSVDIAGTAVGGAVLGGLTSTATTNVTLPDQVNVGLAWMPDDAWTLSVDVDWVNWTTFDSIDIQYASATYRGAVSLLQAAVGAPVTGATSLPQNWDATVAFRVGAEWRYSSNMRARFGYTFDPTPVSDPTFTPAIPDSDRHLFAVGYGYDMSPNTTIDLAYMFTYFTDRSQTQSPLAPPGAPEALKNGEYSASAHIIGISVAHRF